MVRLLIVRAVGFPPDEVVRAYRRSIELRPKAVNRATRSEVRVLDDHRLRFVSEGFAREGHVRIDGIVTFEDDRSWTCRRELEVDGHPYSWEIEKYHLAERPGGSDLTLDCELHARGPLQEALLAFGKGRLMVQRTRELDRWLPKDPEERPRRPAR